MAEHSLDIDVDAEQELEIQRPQVWSVVLFNDDFTPMNFVIDVLVDHLDCSDEEAVQITMQVHEQGRGKVGAYTKEIAEGKAGKIMRAAVAASHPLEVAIEPAHGPRPGPKP